MPRKTDNRAQTHKLFCRCYSPGFVPRQIAHTTVCASQAPLLNRLAWIKCIKVSDNFLSHMYIGSLPWSNGTAASFHNNLHMIMIILTLEAMYPRNHLRYCTWQRWKRGSWALIDFRKCLTKTDEGVRLITWTVDFFAARHLRRWWHRRHATKRKRCCPRLDYLRRPFRSDPDIYAHAVCQCRKICALCPCKKGWKNVRVLKHETAKIALLQFRRYSTTNNGYNLPLS